MLRFKFKTVVPHISLVFGVDLCISYLNLHKARFLTSRGLICCHAIPGPCIVLTGGQILLFSLSYEVRC